MFSAHPRASTGHKSRSLFLLRLRLVADQGLNLRKPCLCDWPELVPVLCNVLSEEVFELRKPLFGRNCSQLFRVSFLDDPRSNAANLKRKRISRHGRSSACPSNLTSIERRKLLLDQF